MWEGMRGDERNEVERYRGRERESGLTTHASKNDEEWRKPMHIYSSLIGEVANPHTSSCNKNEREENVNHTHYQQPREHKIWHQDGVC